jgi:hypothetical protein
VRGKSGLLYGFEVEASEGRYASHGSFSSSNTQVLAIWSISIFATSRTHLINLILVDHRKFWKRLLIRSRVSANVTLNSAYILQETWMIASIIHAEGRAIMWFRMESSKHTLKYDIYTL